MTDEERERIKAEARATLDRLAHFKPRERPRRSGLVYKTHEDQPLNTEVENVRDWEQWLDQRLQRERAFLLEVVANALGQALAEQHKADTQEFTREVERLWKVTSELQATIKSYERIDRITRGEPISSIMKQVN